ncbi:MAG: hypothetical protein RI988_234 [Pseudomonadota bacterium]|jgi:hypothetical protein
MTDPGGRRLLRLLLPWGVAVASSACAPALDWRESRPQDTGVQLLLPCRTTSHARELTLAGAPARWVLHSCEAAGMTWAVAWVELADPARVGPVLAELRAAAQANLGAAALQPLGMRAPAGATPNPLSGRFALTGRLPDGRAVRGQITWAVRGTAVLQASAHGTEPDPLAVDTFFDSLRLPG